MDSEKKSNETQAFNVKVRKPSSAPLLAHSPFEINQAVLQGLSVTDSVKAFRNLLWARAARLGVPLVRVSISSAVYTADGGVDASILEGEESIDPDELLTQGTRFQIKTGSFEPWKKHVVRKELFGPSKSEEFEHLGSEIQKALKEKKRIVFVCFGIDPVDRDIRAAQENFQDLFAKCGHSECKVEVWGQTQLIGLFRCYPSLCLQLLGCDHQGFRSRESWSFDDDMQPREHYSVEQSDLLEELRSSLRVGESPHIRLVGEPGVGKTRFALELTKAEDLAPVTLYLKDGRTLLQSSLLNELVQTDDYRFVCFVIDECSPKDLADIWNILKPRSDRIRVITIDHGPDTTVDDKTRIVNVEPTGAEQIISILKDHQVGENDAKRWADYCEGCPRVAHVVGANLNANRKDLLSAPTTSDVWNRFVNGRDSPESENVQLRRIVLCYCSLFKRFGFEPPVDVEANFIQSLAEQCDKRITGPKFRAIVRDLLSRRIIQGTTTLYITPRLLHVHLLREFWQSYGSNFDIAAVLKSMPRQMWDWFAEMLSFVHECEPAERAIDQLLGHYGIFESGHFSDENHNGRLISALAETCPKQTLRCLQRTIGQMEKDALRDLSAARQWLVWALEKLVVWKDCFVNAAELLLTLAETENARNSNNATGVFTSLFSLIPGWSPTQAGPDERIIVLKSAINSDSFERRKLGLQACVKALYSGPTTRIIGPEYQGLRPTIKFWTPKSYAELWDAYQQVWQLMLDKLDTWRGNERAFLISSIIKAAWHVLHVDVCTDSVVDTLKLVASDDLTDTKELVRLIKRQLRDRENLSEKTACSLETICQQLDGNDFASKLQRFVRHATWEDYYDKDFKDSKLVDRKLDELANLVSEDHSLLVPELSWLVSEDSSSAYCFAYRIGKFDNEREWLSRIRHEHSKSNVNKSTTFLSGYLNAVFANNKDEWESIMLELADDAKLAPKFSDIVINSGISDNIARRVIKQCRLGLQSKELLEQWWFAHRLEQLNESVVHDLISLQMEDQIGKLWNNALHMCHSYYASGDTVKSLPEDLTFQLLTSDALSDGYVVHSASYYWARLANGFIQQFPERQWELFQKVIDLSIREWSILEELDANQEAVFTNLCRKDPKNAWACIARAYRQARENGEWLTTHWLETGGFRMIGDQTPGPIQYFPQDVLFEWVDENVEEHCEWISNALPKTFDMSPAGRQTRNFVARYGRNDNFCRGLRLNFHARGWSGNASDFFRSLREKARGWLVDERDENVIRWLSDYIEGLNYDIERAEIEEERRF